MEIRSQKVRLPILILGKDTLTEKKKFFLENLVG